MRREGRVNSECCEETLQRPPGGRTSAVVAGSSGCSRKKLSWGRSSGGGLEAN